MKLILYLLLSFLTTSPDAKVAEQVKLFASDKFQVREKAYHTLDEMPSLPLTYLEKVIETTKDAEVKIRCDRLLQSRLSVSEVTSIWNMDAATRFPFGYTAYREPTQYGMSEEKVSAPVDLAQIYFKKARANFKQHLDPKDIDKLWRQPGVEKEATRLLMADLRKGGMSKDSCEELLRKMRDLEGRIYFSDAWNYNLPGVPRIRQPGEPDCPSGH